MPAAVTYIAEQLRGHRDKGSRGRSAVYHTAGSATVIYSTLPRTHLTDFILVTSDRPDGLPAGRPQDLNCQRLFGIGSDELYVDASMKYSITVLWKFRNFREV